MSQVPRASLHGDIIRAVLEHAVDALERLAEVLADESDGSVRAVARALARCLAQPAGGDQRPGAVRRVSGGGTQRGEGGVPRVTKKRESPSGLSLFLATCSEVGG